MVGFCLCTIQKIHYHVLLAATASVGATAFMLGVDCFTTAGLKEVCLHYNPKSINRSWVDHTLRVPSSMSGISVSMLSSPSLQKKAI